MKCLWYCSLAVIMGAAMISPASGQTDWGSPSQIGSYQSILASHQVQGHQGSAPRNPVQPVPAPGQSVESYGHVQSAPSNPGHAAYQQGPVQSGAPCATAPTACGVGGGAAYAPIYNAPSYSYGGSSGPCYTAPAFTNAGCNTPVASQRGFGIAAAANRNSSVNRVAGVRALFMDRDYENSRFLSYNGAGGELFSNSADLSTMAGVETFFASRNCDGTGWEIRHWSLLPDDADVTLAGSPVWATTTLTGLQWLTHGPSGASAWDIFNVGTTHRIYRENDIHNVELNLLRNGGCFTNRRGRQVNFELLGGVRWFQFDENFTYSAHGSFGGYPAALSYDLDVENTLLGLQLGARTETCITQKLRFSATTKVGLFNNHISAAQCICDENGIAPYVNTGAYTNTPYDFNDETDDFALLGELDLGVIYQLTCKSRLTVGYRAMGISNIALAPDQIPYDFRDVREIRQINSSGNLILHGGYAGLEWCY